MNAPTTLTAVRAAFANIGTWPTIEEAPGQDATSTPWGPSQQTYRYARGITAYSCAGHGGIKVSAGLNTQIPEPLRNVKGWYEEDCEFMIVVLAFPSAFDGSNGFPAVDLAEADRRVRDYFPHQYEAAFGVKVTAAESSVIAREEFQVEHTDDWVAVSASGDWADWVPEGMVGVTATKGGLRTHGAEQARFLVDAAAYADRGKNGYVVPAGTEALA